MVGLLGYDTTQSCKSRKLSPWLKSLRVEHPFKKASRDFHYGDSTKVVVPTRVEMCERKLSFGFSSWTLCCRKRTNDETALRVKAAGAKFLRGGDL